MTFLLGSLLLGGCGGSEEGALNSPEKVAAIANAIKADPQNFKKVLEDHGTDRSKFEMRLYAIAADPAQTDAYIAARKSAR